MHVASNSRNLAFIIYSVGEASVSRLDFSLGILLSSEYRMIRCVLSFGHRFPRLFFSSLVSFPPFCFFLLFSFFSRTNGEGEGGGGERGAVARFGRRGEKSG